MKIVRGFLRLALFGLISFLFLGYGDDSVNLEINWEEGDAFRFIQESDQTINQTIGGQEQAIEQDHIITLRYEVEKNEEEKRTINVTTERIQQNQQMQGQQFSYDSKEPEEGNHPAASALNSMIDRSYQLVLNRGGEVEEVHGLEEIFEEALEDQPEQAEMVTEIFGEEALKQMVNQMLDVHDDKARAVGDEWNQELELTKPLPAKMNINYSLGSIEGDDVNIKANSEIASNEDASPIEMGPMTMRYLLEGEQSGELIFSRSENFIRSQEFEQNLEGTMEVEGGPETPDEIPVEIEGEYKVKGEKISSKE